MSRPASSTVRTDSSSDTSATFLRLGSVVRQTGLGRSTIYRLMAEQRFPRAVRLSGRAIGWRASDLQEWADSRLMTGR